MSGANFQLKFEDMRTAAFYSTYGGDPFFNMAFDEWLFERAIANPKLILARLYTWNTGAITFGFNQNEKLAVDLEKIGNTPLIRRITGGRALLHEPSELTYAIAGNFDDSDMGVLTGTVSRLSKFISEMILEFLSELGINAQIVRQSAADFAQPESLHIQPCFQSYARHEILAENGKIVASAQRRIEGAFLQHGAIKINGVAHHPALPFLANNSLNGRMIHEISKLDFERYARAFKKVLNAKFEMDFESKYPIVAELKELKNRAEIIKANPSGQRFLVKQISSPVRLPHERHN